MIELDRLIAADDDRIKIEHVREYLKECFQRATRGYPCQHESTGLQAALEEFENTQTNRGCRHKGAGCAKRIGLDDVLLLLVRREIPGGPHQ